MCLSEMVNMVNITPGRRQHGSIVTASSDHADVSTYIAVGCSVVVFLALHWFREECAPSRKNNSLHCDFSECQSENVVAYLD